MEESKRSRLRASEFIGKVLETFDIKGRGVVLATDTTFAQLPEHFTLKIGETVELWIDEDCLLQTNVAGVEHCDPWTPRSLFGILLPREIAKDAVPIGAELWVVRG